MDNSKNRKVYTATGTYSEKKTLLNFGVKANHLGNVLATVSDRKIPHETTSGTIDYYIADIISATDFFPAGGMEMPGRNFSSNSYKFGYTSHEKVDEVSGSGNTVDMGGRMLDARLDRTPTPDPLTSKFPSESPYIYAGNNPIYYIDKNGKFKIEVTKEAQDAGVTAQTISNFETVVANMQKMVEANPAILKKMSEQTGLSETELKGWMVYGEGPTITIGSGITFEGASGNTSGIKMEASLINSIDNTKSTDANYESTLFATGMLVLHEATHVGDAQTNDNVTTGTEGDMGKQNTKSKFGHRGMDTDNTILGMSVSVTGSSQTDDWSFTKSDLNKVKEKLSPNYGGGFFNKMYKKVVDSFKKDKPQETKVKYQ